MRYIAHHTVYIVYCTIYLLYDKHVAKGLKKYNGKTHKLENLVVCSKTHSYELI